MGKSTEEIDKIKKDWAQKATSLGLSTASSLMSNLYPLDFEAYQISFELCDYNGKTLDYFSFPIMPSELSISEETPVKVENTFGGVNALSSNIYVPKNVKLSGNFGRQFRLIARNKITIPIIGQATQERDYGVGGKQRKEKEISNLVKTGYGCFKVLQSIINRSVEVNNGECNKLYFYNLAYGESYLVKPINFRGYQTINNNGIWSYDLDLKAICPLHLDSAKMGGKWKNFAGNFIQSGFNAVTRGVMGML